MFPYSTLFSSVMAALEAAIQLYQRADARWMDGRVKPAHDGVAKNANLYSG